MGSTRSTLMFVAGTEVMRSGGAAGEAAGTEDRGRGLIRDLQTVEELPHGWLVGSEETRRFGLEFEVQVADGPADTGGGRGRDGEGNFEYRLRLLAGEVTRGVGLPEDVVVLEGSQELESKLRAVIGGAAPQAFGELLAVDLERDFRKRGVGRSDGAGDKLHTEIQAGGAAQNKK